MALKEEVLRLLEQSEGEFLSGEALAACLGVSRAAVWKAVRALKAEGREIIAVTNRGYRLSGAGDVLSREKIEKHYAGPVPLEISIHRSVDSTNTQAKAAATAGAPEGTVIIAGEQTAGRGRLGRSFFSPGGSGMYMSVVLRPQIGAERSVALTAAAAVAVAEAIEALSGRKAEIKWVNDVFVDGKKVCGILTEASFGMELGALEYAVLGMGINVYPPKGGFPPEISDIAGAVFDAPRRDLKNMLAGEILSRFFGYYARLSEGGFIGAYRERSAVVGRSVTVLRGGTGRQAFALGIDDGCRLHVRYSDGSEEYLSSGEISVKMTENEGHKDEEKQTF